jgi:hypothetical protein
VAWGVGTGHWLAGYRLAGYRLAGYRLAGYRVAGYRVAGYRVAGYRVAGYRVAGHGFEGALFEAEEGNRRHSVVPWSLRVRRGSARTGGCAACGTRIGGQSIPFLQGPCRRRPGPVIGADRRTLVGTRKAAGWFQPAGQAGGWAGRVRSGAAESDARRAVVAGRRHVPTQRPVSRSLAWRSLSRRSAPAAARRRWRGRRRWR